MQVARLMCCGWREIGSVRGYVRGNLRTAIRYFADAGVVIPANNRTYCGALLFTEAGTRSRYATNLAKDIEAAGLGVVTKLPRFINPNTGRSIQGYAWALNGPALLAYCLEQGITR